MDSPRILTRGFHKGAVFEPTLDPEKEQALLRKAMAGDRPSFGSIVEAHRERAYAAALSLTQNHEDARDLSQEAFIKAFRALSRFQAGRPFFPWYYRILRNTCLSYIQKHGPHRKVSLDRLVEEDHVQFETADEDVRDRIQRDQMAKHVRVELEKLKPEFREIIAMKHFEEMSYEEIAEALQIPIGTVMSRLFHARKALAERMKKYRS